MTKSIQHIDPDTLTIVRRRYGSGFQYFDGDGRKIKDRSLLKRIKQLVIPPMWQEVRVCAAETGHIQAVGRDAKGRKQYRYHPDWEAQRQQEKFAKMKDFGLALPQVRQVCYQHIEQVGWPREKILSLMLLILDETGIRIGNQQYAVRNATYGLSTLRRKHLKEKDGAMRFVYTGKSHQKRSVAIEDEALAAHIRKVAELPGYEIFRYREGRSWRDVHSEDVNEYIHQLIGDDYSSKDFRTWAACRLAIEEYPNAQKIVAENPRRKLESTLVKRVAQRLGNTPTICRNYYIHPVILQSIGCQMLPDPADFQPPSSDHQHSVEEQTLLRILKGFSKK